ncbi:glycosyltransferase family 32 protein [Thalassococcus profundi]|nr:capsular polysaccharide synthesis protein [Thalassococcus profundi]
MQSRSICCFWAQGRDAAPDLVRRCWDAWAALNPDWTLTVYDETDAATLFEEIGLAHVPRTMQGQADIFRVAHLARSGGVYVDAATVPIQPLSDWLPDWAGEGFFAFHDPYRKREVENWFLYSDPHHPISEAWIEAMLDYWQQPRRPQIARTELDPGAGGALAHRWANLKWRLFDDGARAKKVMEPRRRGWSVDRDGGAARAVYPYFWPHYLFADMLSRRPEAAARWDRVPKMPSYKQLMVRHWKRRFGSMSDASLKSLIVGSQMQKLPLYTQPSDAQADLIFDQIAWP